MSTSANKRHYVRSAVLCSILIALLFVFGTVYDHFSRGVHSDFMRFSFLVPLVLCVIPYALLSLRKNAFSSRLAFNVYNSGVGILCLACIFKGVVYIAGTESRYVIPLFIAGGAVVLAGTVIYFVSFISNKKNKSEA